MTVNICKVKYINLINAHVLQCKKIKCFLRDSSIAFAMQNKCLIGLFVFLKTNSQTNVHKNILRITINCTLWS